MTKATFIFRWDDISPFQDVQKFGRLADLFAQYRIPAVLGVIPDNHDDSIRFNSSGYGDFAARLKDLEKLGWEIAMHGYRHLKHTEDGGLLGLNRASEFAGRSYEEQAADIRRGKTLLNESGFDPVTFIAPWHAYDWNTLRALVECGFKAISDGWSLFPSMTAGLLQVPVIFWSAPNRLKMLDRLGGIYTICLHPHLVGDDDLARLERFFRDYSPTVLTIKALAGQAEVVSRKTPRKRVLEGLFARLYKRRENE
jgi:peptidoglycan/xylan/chitin deacetylase (PgdA/CDA1 family)